jgi:hypothetical protein
MDEAITEPTVGTERMNAYVITALMREGAASKPVVAALFAPNAPSGKDLKRMGFMGSMSTEKVGVIGAQPSGPVLYFFERTPAASEVTVARVDEDWTLRNLEKKQGEPHTIIPQLSGQAAEKHINPRGALNVSDFPKKKAASAPEDCNPRRPGKSVQRC